MKQELPLHCLDCGDSLQDCTCIEDTINMTQETIEEVDEYKKQQQNIILNNLKRSNQQNK
jgi:hypothetical protein